MNPIDLECICESGECDKQCPVHALSCTCDVGPYIKDECPIHDNRIKPPKYLSKMIFISEKFLTITKEAPMPNWWWRLWQYLLLGIKWEKIDV